MKYFNFVNISTSFCLILKVSHVLAFSGHDLVFSSACFTKAPQLLHLGVLLFHVNFLFDYCQILLLQKDYLLPGTSIFRYTWSFYRFFLKRKLPLLQTCTALAFPADFRALVHLF